ncbi:CinA family protein [Pediococcus siamensis]|uniref:CinA family protein n=1 Tax=Pediococcus siamensis TaxID=381829 RepID=UPI0039A247FE
MANKLAHFIVETLIEKNISITAAESLTGGLFQAQITSVPGSSAIFRGGFVTYADEIKTQLLGVPAEVIQQYGVVSYEVAVAMANGAQHNLQTDLAISFTGAAGPASLEGQAAGTAWIGINFQGQTDAYEIQQPDLSRNDFREFCCEQAFQKISDLVL